MGSGRSHDRSFSLFRIGDTASDGFKTFCETGQSDGLDAQSQGEGGVFDEFNGPAISSGQGTSLTEFFVDGNHTQVSIAVRIVPSPDWFVGLDSLQLCKNGFWIDALSVQTGPMDAGTDSGFTFTAPNWPSEPRQKISHITAQQPSHPANSFYYPEKKRLPPVATFHFHKDKVYHLSEDTGQMPIDNRVHTIDDLERVLLQDDVSNDVLPSIVDDQTQRSKSKKHRRTRKGTRRAVSCQVGEWGPWSPCSLSCGIGESTRSRKVLKHSRRGGRPCPPLAESKWCGEHTACPQRFFNW
ncbi:spondin-2 isoform X3 [Cryptotermes secundus]|uniref:spondin-2 isoform X3 n=1 Tax=Cryptotermes secundus TaxID=105785 RepID=UPI000CD7C37A|nr:spondin-2 isoform X3 [Cryptotermes secundus]